MKTKLTLSVDKNLVQFARQQAKSSDTSISSIFSDFLLSKKTSAEKKTVPSVANMVGSLKRYAVDDSKPAIRSAYAKKYSN